MLKPLPKDPEVADLKRIPIGAITQRLGIKLDAKGDTSSCLCPLHNDKSTPSFIVYHNTNSFFCFGCRAGGDNIELVLRIKQQTNSLFSFQDAVNWLSENFLSLSVTSIVKPVKVEPKIVPPENVIYWHSLLYFNDKQRWFEKRGFHKEFIDKELWGFDGSRYTIPIWEGKPGNSNCLGVRLRKQTGHNGPKYIGLKDHNQNTVWGRHYCNYDTVLAFAGELDAARAVQDGLPAFSVVNGMYAFTRFPNNWANDWFPKVKNLIIAYDKNETAVASKLAVNWNKQKGSFSAKIFQWSPDLGVDDYCDFRDKYPYKDFLLMLKDQTGEINWKS
jgi:hypothetical protein